MTEREILHAIIHKNVLVDTDLDLSSRLTPEVSALPKSWVTPSQVNAMRSYDGQIFGGFITAVRGSVTNLVKGLSRDPGVPYKRLRLKDLSDELVAPSDLTAIVAKSSTTMEHLDQVRRAVNELGEGEQRDSMAESLDAISAARDRVAAIGLRRAWAELLQVDGDPARDARFLDDLVWTWVFRKTAENVLVEVLGSGVNQASMLAKQIPTESCPGAWLSHQIDLEIRKRENEPTPSSAYDLDHLVYLPYVDVFYTDTRIADYVRIVLRRANLPPELVDRVPPMAFGRSVPNLARSFGGP